MPRFASSNPRADLILPVHAGLKGEFRWQVLDERGVPEIPRNPSGFAIAPIEGVRQDNLITDVGLDRFGQNHTSTSWYGSFFGYETSTYQNTEYDYFRLFLAVGTGSVAPSAGDTALANEVQRASSSGSFSQGSFSGTIDSGNDELVATSIVNRQVTMTADRNLTEIGFSFTSGGAINIRELLRDGVGDPVTVSLLNGKSLLVTHTLRGIVPIPPAGTAGTISIEEYDASNTLVNTLSRNIVHGPHVLDTTRFNAYGFMGNTQFFIPGRYNDNFHTVSRLTAASTYAPVGTTGITSGDISYGTASADPYVAGSFERTRYVTVDPGDQVGDWHGYHIGVGTSGTPQCGHLVVFDAPYTKLNTDTIRVGTRFTWGRV